MQSQRKKDAKSLWRGIPLHLLFVSGGGVVNERGLQLLDRHGKLQWYSPCKEQTYSGVVNLSFEAHG